MMKGLLKSRGACVSWGGDEMKIIIAYLTVFYDFKYSEGRGRPRKITASKTVSQTIAQNCL